MGKLEPALAIAYLGFLHRLGKVALVRNGRPTVKTVWFVLLCQACSLHYAVLQRETSDLVFDYLCVETTSI